MPRSIPEERRSELGRLVRAARKRLGLTQKELAAHTGGAVSLAHVGLIETGDRNASLETVQLLVMALADVLTEEERAQMFLAADVFVPNAVGTLGGSPHPGRPRAKSGAAMPEDLLDEDLTADEWAQVRAFIAGMRANREAR